MSWDPIVLNDITERGSLPTKIKALFEQQRNCWPLFAKGEVALESLMVKKFKKEGATVIVQANPARSRSTNAKVDPKSIAKRACFLCPENIPKEERGISYGEYVVLPNPFPITKNHLTVPLRSHTPQKLQGSERELLNLAKELGPQMAAFYNGPCCGASAPDHFHFQICTSSLPLIDEIQQIKPESLRAESSFGRRYIVHKTKKIETAEKRILAVVEALKKALKRSEEPPLNILCRHDGEYFETLIFPRSKHRPKCCFAQGSKRLLISPATLEMAGVLVILNIDDYDRVDEKVIYSVFDEVTHSRDLIENLVESLK